PPSYKVFCSSRARRQDASASRSRSAALTGSSRGMFSANQALARRRNSSTVSAVTANDLPPRLCRSSVELVLGDCTAPLEGCTDQRLGLVQVHRGTNECL